MPTFLELLIAIEQNIQDRLKINSDYTFYLCDRATTVLGFALYKSVFNNYPEFKDWIMEEGTKLSNDYELNDPWNCNMKTKLKILRKKIKQLEKENKNV